MNRNPLARLNKKNLILLKKMKIKSENMKLDRLKSALKKKKQGLELNSNSRSLSKRRMLVS